MRTFPLRTAIVVLWLAAMGWFIRYEAFPGWFTGALAGYKSLLTEGEVFSDSWMLIQFKGQNIGYSHTQIEMDDQHPTARYKIVGRTLMTLDLGSEPQLVNVGSVTTLDSFQNLSSFEFSMNARRYAMEVKGTRREGTQFSVVVKTGSATSKSMVSIPDDVVIYSPMTMMSLGRMKPGETAKLRTFDPMSISKGAVAVEDVLVKALGKKTYAWGTNSTEATELSVTYHEMELKALVDADGRVLREDTPFGWSMVISTPEEAMMADRKKDGPKLDILAEMGVPVRGTITDPDACRELKLHLRGLHFSINEVASARQQVEMSTNNSVVITLRKGATASPVPLGPEEREAALASSSYIQSDDPVIRKKAEEITHGLATDREKAIAIKNWVFTSVKKNLTVSIPSALDVLKQREGDCNEHTYLYVALARAIGLPAQVRVGIVYKDGSCFYHAWPAAYVGHWLELDPTLNYDEVGTRHITLLQGELASQAKLMSAMGQLRVEVLEQKY